MTVPANQVPISTVEYYGPTSATIKYSVDYRLLEEEDLKATYIDETGVRIALINPTQFEVALINEGDDGADCTIHYDTGSPYTGRIELRRQMVQEQPTVWVEYGPFKAELLELGLDRDLMIIQEMQVLIDGGALNTGWMGNWATGVEYKQRDLVVGPDGNWYYCNTAHISGDFDLDLKNDNWLLTLDIEHFNSLVAAAAASAAAAAQSALEALNSAAAAKLSETNSATSELNASLSENNASNCAAEAHQSAEEAEQFRDDAAAIVAQGERIDAVETQTFQTSAGQTRFELNNANKHENLIVFMNSRKLREYEDYTCSDPDFASHVDLLTPAALGDEVDVVSFNAYKIGDAGVQAVLAGARIVVDNTEPSAPIIHADPTNLSLTKTATTNQLASSTGSDIVLAAVDAINAGLMTVDQLLELQAATAGVAQNAYDIANLPPGGGGSDLVFSRFFFSETELDSGNDYSITFTHSFGRFPVSTILYDPSGQVIKVKTVLTDTTATLTFYGDPGFGAGLFSLALGNNTAAVSTAAIFEDTFTEASLNSGDDYSVSFTHSFGVYPAGILVLDPDGKEIYPKTSTTLTVVTLKFYSLPAVGTYRISLI